MLGRALPRPVKLAVKRLLGRPADDGIASELAFWDLELNGKGSYPHTIHTCSTPSLRDQVFPRELVAVFEEVKGATAGRVPRVDVGPEPLSTLMWGHDAGLFELHCVDLLAVHYGEMLLRHSISVPVIPVEGTAERLVEIFPWRWFDVAHANNSLDHTVSPRVGLINMLAVTRPGGLIVLRGNVREGTNGKWEGLHQHDLWLRGEELMLTNRSGRTRSLTGDLPLECLFRRLDAETPGAEMLIVWRVIPGGEPTRSAG